MTYEVIEVTIERSGPQRQNMTASLQIIARTGFGTAAAAPLTLLPAVAAITFQFAKPFGIAGGPSIDHVGPRFIGQPASRRRHQLLPEPAPAARPRWARKLSYKLRLSRLPLRIAWRRPLPSKRTRVMWLT